MGWCRRRCGTQLAGTGRAVPRSRAPAGCRRVMLPGSGRDVVLSDTVGFISDLPTQLIEAFQVWCWCGVVWCGALPMRVGL